MKSCDYGCTQPRPRIYIVIVHDAQPCEMDLIVHLIKTVFRRVHWVLIDSVLDLKIQNQVCRPIKKSISCQCKQNCHQPSLLFNRKGYRFSFQPDPLAAPASTKKVTSVPTRTITSPLLPAESPSFVSTEMWTAYQPSIPPKGSQTFVSNRKVTSLCLRFNQKGDQHFNQKDHQLLCQLEKPPAFVSCKRGTSFRFNQKGHQPSPSFPLKGLPAFLSTDWITSLRSSQKRSQAFASSKKDDQLSHQPRG